MIKNLFYTVLLLMISFPGYLHGESNSYPKRIVSLGPTITENLYLLGVQDRLIANTVYCERPPDAKTKEKIGTVIQVNVERIMSLKPDLIIATPLTKPEQIKIMKNLGLTIEMFPNSKDFRELCTRFVNLGKLLGKEESAKNIIRDSKIKVSRIRNKTKNLPKQSVFIQLGARPLFTAIKNTFVHSFIDFAGGNNIAADAKTGMYSREKVLQSNPDVILIVTMGIAGEKEKQIWQKFKTINAVKTKRVHIIDSYKVCSPTPETFVEALEEIIEYLHPGKEIGIE